MFARAERTIADVTMFTQNAGLIHSFVGFYLYVVFLVAIMGLGHVQAQLSGESRVMCHVLFVLILVDVNLSVDLICLEDSRYSNHRSVLFVFCCIQYSV